MPYRKKLLERNIERPVVNWAKKKKWRARKMNGLGDRAWPDRLFVGPGVMAFIEFKVPGKVPTVLQQEVLDDLCRWGHHARWFDNADNAIQWLRRLEAKALPEARGEVAAGKRSRRSFSRPRIREDEHNAGNVLSPARTKTDARNVDHSPASADVHGVAKRNKKVE